ncbi:glycosyltransferase family 4 protein [Pseudomonas sp. RIT-PI-S]|uniref:glycosyltransferase family 4 protein n=1 Tax=Pseudomonas sp. RIT-PI-S TaxID=3035295 RepID=UPI0021DAE4C1|nr:glycosyltransferase family 4 protein [Pseudomonas sp. RIT-PI-S]
MATIAMFVWNDFRHDARVLKEAQTLAGAGHEVTVHALLAPGHTPAEQTMHDGVKVRRLPRSPLGGKASASRSGGVGMAWKIATRLLTHLRFCWRLARQGADVIHAHDVNVLPTAWLAARLSGARIVYDAHEISTSREGYGSLRRLVGALEHSLFSRMDGTITTTNARAKFFARAYNVQRPVVLQNRPRRSAVPPTDRLRDELSLPQRWPIILYQGGLQQGRGLEGLIGAMATVPRAYLVLIGGGQLGPRLRQLAKDPALERRVFIVPTVPLAQLPSYSAAADIGVQPIVNTCLNHATTDSNKLFEYIMAGLPVVATDLREIRAVVQGYRVGELVPSGDTAQLAHTLRRLVEAPALRETYRRNACRARAELHWESQESRLLGLYAALLGAPVACPR